MILEHDDILKQAKKLWPKRKDVANLTMKEEAILEIIAYFINKLSVMFDKELKQLQLQNLVLQEIIFRNKIYIDKVSNIPNTQEKL